MDNSNALPLGSAAAPAKERTTASRIKSIFSGSVSPSPIERGRG